MTAELGRTLAVGGTREVPVAGSRRPRLHPARAPPRPAPAGDRRRLLRPGGAQGPGRHGAAAVARAARRRRRRPAYETRRRGRRRPAPSLARPPACRARDARPRAGRRGHPVPRPGPALLRDHPHRCGRTRGSRPPQRASTPCSPATAPSPNASPSRTRAGPCRPTGSAPSWTRSCRATGPGRRRHFDLPPGDDLAVTLVTAQPWSGYNWYDGGYRSRVDFNLDLPVQLPRFVGVVAHETYPGHHLEHASKEAVLVEQLGHGESSHPAHQHARVPRLRGAREPRARARGAAGCAPGPARGAGAGRRPAARRGHDGPA